MGHCSRKKFNKFEKKGRKNLDYYFLFSQVWPHLWIMWICGYVPTDVPTPEELTKHEDTVVGVEAHVCSHMWTHMRTCVHMCGTIHRCGHARDHMWEFSQVCPLMWTPQMTTPWLGFYMLPQGDYLITISWRILQSNLIFTHVPFISRC